MEDRIARIEQLSGELLDLVGRAVGAEELAGVGDDELLRFSGAAGLVLRAAEALVIGGVGEFESRSGAYRGQDGLAARLGCRSVNELVQRSMLVSSQSAARLITGARAVHRDVSPSSGERMPAAYPAMREALIDGAVGLDGLNAVVQPLAGAVKAAGRDAQLAADEELAASARGCGAEDAPPATPEDLRAQAEVWATFLDQDGSEPAEARALRERSFRLGPTRGGLVPVSGRLLPEVAAQFRLICDSVNNPKVDAAGRALAVDAPRGGGVPFGGGTAARRAGAVAGQSSPGGGASDGEDPSGGGILPGDGGSGGSGPWFHEEGDDVDDAERTDLRTHEQKQHDALATALAVAAGSGELPTLGGTAPTLVVSVREEDLQADRGRAHVDGEQAPVPLAVARHAACSGRVQRVVFDADGRILSLGVLDRVFTHHQRRAITLRDGGCLIPGCRVRAKWCEVHHVEEHARGGPTHTDNGVLLCWFHHRTLDSGGWRIRMNGGVPEVRGPMWWDPGQRWRRPTSSPTRLRDRLARAR